jgi:hypothetical protein
MKMSAFDLRWPKPEPSLNQDLNSLDGALDHLVRPSAILSIQGGRLSRASAQPHVSGAPGRQQQLHI